MCLVIDTCCMGSVLDPKNENHTDFKPVFEWVTKGRGKILYGGTKYKNELRNIGRYLSLLAELNRKGRIVQLDDRDVDRVHKEVQKKANNKKFNDPHIIAIVIVASCRIVCTKDKCAHPFIKEKILYPKGFKRPSIYSSCKNASLLRDDNIARICMD